MRSILAVVAVFLAVFLYVVSIPVQSYQATSPEHLSWCQCVDYVRNRFALGPTRGWFSGAADMGPYLEAQGFARIHEPQVGAVAVFPPWFGAGIDTVYGHAGVVQQIEPQEGRWKLTVRGARQTVPEWVEHGCSNISDMGHVYVAMEQPNVAFYIARGRLVVAEPLTLSSVSPFTSETIQASFAVQNVGQQAITLDMLMAGGRRGSHWDSAELADFSAATAIVLEPGHMYHYVGARSIDATGDYFAEPAVLIDGTWSQIEGANRITYTAQAAPPAPTATTVPTLTATIVPTATAVLIRPTSDPPTE
ncbi:MAG: CHAP domain-containing protein [Chloroflexaceae bacterium]|nr:CHAP domain-containing protein [Chloroflexaceae bacterium]